MYVTLNFKWNDTEAEGDEAIEVFEYEVEAEVYMYQDLYGADRDGNRGQWQTFTEIQKLTVLDKEGKKLNIETDRNGKPITMTDLAFHKLTLEIEEKAIEYYYNE